MTNTNMPQLWPGWETVDIIGRGSFGAVYEIQREVFGEVEKAALKVISIPQNSSDIDEMYGDGYDDESITSTFQNYLKSIVAEYSLMKKLGSCPYIVNCDDIRYTQHDDGFGWDIFIKMELLTPLKKKFGNGFGEEDAIRLGKDICRALALCEQNHVLHRDIKPENIFVSDYGDYKLGDFGIAKTVEKTMGGTKTGTYKYMAPEVYNNLPYNGTVDIYSLGLVLYWMLNERRTPFMPLPPETPKAGDDEKSRLRRFSGEAIPAPVNGSAELKAIVLKACAFDPKDRYRSAAEMLEALENIGKKPEPEPEPGPQPDPKPTPESELEIKCLEEERKHREREEQERLKLKGREKTKEKKKLGVLIAVVAWCLIVGMFAYSREQAMKSALTAHYAALTPMPTAVPTPVPTPKPTPRPVKELNYSPIIDDSNDGSDIISGDFRSVDGTEYINATKYWVNDTHGLLNVEHTLYDLAGKYVELSGEIALAEENSCRASVEFVFYGDGIELYRTEYISGSEKDHFRFNVSGVCELRVECVTYETCDCFGIVTAMLYA